ncbi:MAG: tRNA pseudouridine(13) synthase TruD [Deltaproteobacteria bacterium]|nr:tRNA pseudouridine(13) synthase TruD [Deltaproteobacteria bacterium]
MTDLPYLTADLPGTGGVLRTRDEDFFVDEEPAYLPSGAGDHVFVRIEKRGMTSRHAVAQVARALGVAERDIGIAGMKDRHAVTRQWLSLPPPATPELALAMTIENITILEASRHPHKLRTGHVRGNKFVLRVRGAATDSVERARAILARLAETPGAPNWYGEQRFGRDGDNAQKGRDLVSGARKLGRDKKLDRLFVSALQSELFNAWLVARMGDGMYRRVVVGDVLHKTGGGMFVCEDAATDEARLGAGELVLTGPMFGDKMRRPPDGTPAAEREAAVLAAAGLEAAAFGNVRALAEGTRRDATITVADASVSAVASTEDERGETFEVAFALPGGAYATAVMREVMKTVPQRVDDTPDAG